MQIDEILETRSRVMELAPPLTRVPTDPSDEAVEFQLKKAIAVHLKLRGRLYFTQQFLDMAASLATEYLHDLCKGLRTDMELQRRQKPALPDMKVLFRVKGIPVWNIYEEGSLTKKIYQYIKYDVDKISLETQGIIARLNETGICDDDEPLHLFFTNEQYEIALLVPTHTTKPSYIPSYLPELPPDYTFQHTPQYLETTTDLKKLRVNLVDQSRIAEKLLYNLIEDDDTKWKQQLEHDLEESDNDRMSLDGDHPLSGTEAEEKEVDDKPEKPEEAPAANGSVKAEPKGPQPLDPQDPFSIDYQTGPVTPGFDIVKYAALRTKIAAKREGEVERRRKKRNRNVYMQMEKYFSPYATNTPTPEVAAQFDAKVTALFKATIRTLRSQEVAKREQLAEIVAERERQETARQAERDKNDFAFSFNRMGDEPSLDSDDDFLANYNQPLPAISAKSPLPPTGSTASKTVPAAPAESDAPVPTLKLTLKEPAAAPAAPEVSVEKPVTEDDFALEHELDAALLNNDDDDDDDMEDF